MSDDREPRAAVGAVDERIAVPTIVLIPELSQAVVAGRDVRCYERLLFADRGAPLDTECLP